MDITATRLGSGNTLTLGLAGQNGINFYVGGSNVGNLNSSGDLSGIGTITSENLVIASNTRTQILNASGTNGMGVGLLFSDHDNTTNRQTGFLDYFHQDQKSYGSGNAFIFSSNQLGPSGGVSVVIDGKLLFKDSFLMKPATGTGPGTELIDSARNVKNVASVTSQGVIKSKNAGVTNAVVATHAYLLSEHTESGVQVIADDGGDFAAWMALSNANSSSGANKHYWLHNAPSTASSNAGDLEIRYSTTTAAGQIGGQGTGSTAIAQFGNSGNFTIAGRMTASDGTLVKAAYGFASSSTTGISYSSTNNRVNILSGGAVKAYVQTGSSNPQVDTMYVDGLMSVNGSISWDGGGSALANVGYNKRLNYFSFDTSNGVLTATLGDNTTKTVDLDGRYLALNDTSQNISGANITASGTITLSGSDPLLKKGAYDYLDFDDDSQTYTTGTNATVLASISDVLIRTNTNDGGGGLFRVSTGANSPVSLFEIVAGTKAATFAGNVDINGTTLEVGDGGTNGVIDVKATANAYYKVNGSTALTLTATSATFAGSLTATGNSSIDRITLKASSGYGTGGGRLLDGVYSGDNHLWTLSSDHSSGALTIGYGADSSTTGSQSFVSTFDNFNGKRSAVQFRSDRVNFWGTNANVQTTVGSALTTMSNRISLHTDDGSADFDGTISSSGHTITSSGTIGGATIANGYLKITDGSNTLGIDPNEIMSDDTLYLNSAYGEVRFRGNNSAGAKLFNGNTQFMSASRDLTVKTAVIQKTQVSGVVLTLRSDMADLDGSGARSDGVAMNFEATDDNATFTPQAQIRMIVKDYSGDAGMPSEGTGNLAFYTGVGSGSSGGGSLNEVMRLMETGNVSIGSADSIEKLYVVGNIRSSGNLTADNSLIVNGTTRINSAGVATLGTTTTGALTAGAITATSLSLSGAFTPTSIAATSTVSGSQFRASYGSVSAPAFTFKNDDDTGMWSAGGNVKFAVGGSNRMTIGASATTVSGRISVVGDLQAGSVPQTIITTGRALQNVTSVTSSGAIQGASVVASGSLKATGSGDGLLLGNTSGSGAGIRFSDHTNDGTGQNGFLRFYHPDGLSYGSGCAWTFTSTESTLSVLVDGKLLMKDGLFLKPSSGTGAGTAIIGSAGNITSPSTISATGAIKSEVTVSGVTASTYAMLLAKHTEAGIQVCAENSGGWAAWIGMTTGSRHYWWHNAPTSGQNGGDLELRTSTTTTAAQIGGQGNDSSVLLHITNTGLLTVDNDIKTNSRIGIGSVGSVSAPSVYSNTDTNTGIYWPAADELGFVTGGSERVCVTSDGIDVSGDINVSGDIVMSGANNFLVIENSQENNAGIVFNDLQAGAWPAASSQRFMMQYNSGGESGVGSMIMGHDDDSYNGFYFKKGGELECKGNVTAYGSTSDIRLKDSVERIADPISKVQQLDGITFRYKKDGSRSTGLIAQQLLEVLPEVVYETADLDSGDTHYAVRYGQVVGLLVEAIKNQQDQIDLLKETIEEMKNGNHKDD